MLSQLVYFLLIGAFKAKFTIDYYQNGVAKQLDSGGYPVGQARSLSIPPDATFVLIRAFADVFVNNWSVIFNDAIGVPLIKCYEISGTTLNTKWKITDGCVFRDF